MKRLSAILVALLAVYALADEVGKPIPTDPGLMRAEIVKLRAQVASLEKQLATAKGATTQKVATSQPAKDPFAINTPERGWEARARALRMSFGQIRHAQAIDAKIRELLSQEKITGEQADLLLDGKLAVGMPVYALQFVGRVWAVDGSGATTITGFKFFNADGTEPPTGPVLWVRSEAGKITAIGPGKGTRKK